MTPEQLSEVAEKVSAAANRWLTHPAEAHQAHEQAASAWENVGHINRAREHRRAASYWAKKELEWNSEKYALGKLRN